MTARFSVSPTAINGLHVVQRRALGDKRGFLERVFCDTDLQEIWGPRSIRQINHTFTEACGTLRGLHFQRPPNAEFKWVSCLVGEVFDVAIDLRIGSPTFLKFHSEILSSENSRTLAIPEGFAHGFQTLTDRCQMLYLHSAVYDPQSEGALHALDPRLNIPWPLPVTAQSERDKTHPMLDGTFEGLDLRSFSP